MTNEEKHALIAEKLEGWSPVEGGSPGAWRNASGEWAFLPNYSRNLNLCARFEAKICELGPAKRAVYLRYFRIHMPSEDGSCVWWMLSAPASVRVDAAVAMIQSGALDQTATPDAQTSPERDVIPEVMP